MSQLVAEVPKERFGPNARWWSDFLFKVIVAVIGGVWAGGTFLQQREQNERIVKLQVEAQYAASRSQREIAEVQIVAGIIPLMKCEAPKRQRAFATELLQKMDSRYADAVLLSTGSCPESVTSLLHSTQEVARKESRRTMLEHLRIAGQLLDLGLFRDATLEYNNAYQVATGLKGQEEQIDESAARKGLDALASKNFEESAQWFHAAFQKVATER